MAAVNTAITTRPGGFEVGPPNCLTVYQRTIDFSATGNNLANGDWFQLFTIPIGAVILDGLVKVVTVDAGGGTIVLGKAGGNEILTAMALSAAITQKVTNPRIQLSTTVADTLDICAGTAAITTAVVSIWLLVLEAQGAAAAS